MGKDKGSKISGAGTLSLDTEELKNALERKEYGKNDGKLLPPGTYECEIIEAELTEQGGNGTTAGSPKYTLRLQVVDGENQGRVCFARAIAHGSTAGQLFNMFQALGIDVESMGNTVTLPTERQIEQWVGTHVVAYVKHREYNGNPQLDVTLDPTENNGSSTKQKKQKPSKIAK